MHGAHSSMGCIARDGTCDVRERSERRSHPMIQSHASLAPFVKDGVEQKEDAGDSPSTSRSGPFPVLYPIPVTPYSLSPLQKSVLSLFGAHQQV